jgi:hypothetical protein
MQRAVLVAGCAASLAACGHKDVAPPATADSNATFVAFPSTFQSFRTWTSFHDDGPADDGTFPPAVLGPRTQYINQVPPHGAKEFPVGTVIVEARESGQMLILGGVKRGGSYNSGGAVDWEWFGLAEDPMTHAVSISWRGLQPPIGGYGGIPTAGCNECHQSCGADNDYVCSPELQLASF